MSKHSGNQLLALLTVASWRAWGVARKRNSSFYLFVGCHALSLIKKPRVATYHNTGSRLFRQKLSSVSDEVLDVRSVSQVTVYSHHYAEGSGVSVERVVG